MGKALVVYKDKLPRDQRSSLAAQYVRMSTDRQQYSIENQAAAIAAYAHAHNLTIVSTYADRGESGLGINNRVGLKQLIHDVTNDLADFRAILVYDVSRWGRFQDTDESAHYEFICKKAGVKVIYCAEQFENDGTIYSSIAKNLKRVMAAEYSRELSVRVHTGACRYAQLGYRVCGRPGYALDRVLVDEKKNPKGILHNGERKYLTTDHVILRPGSKDKVEIVQWIFRTFLKKTSEAKIAAELNRKAILSSTGAAWDGPAVGRVLRNENYVGNMTYNKQSSKLGSVRATNSQERWIRSNGCIEPIIDIETFLAAQKIIKERRVDISKEEMLIRLKKTLDKEGRLNPRIIDRTIGLPSVPTYVTTFGSLRKAYDLIGYKSRKNCQYLDQRGFWDGLTTDLIGRLIASFQQAGISIELKEQCLYLENGENIAALVARWMPPQKETHNPHWSLNRRSRVPASWIAAIRLDDHNDHVLDYVLIPPHDHIDFHLRFSEKARSSRGITRFATSKALAISVTKRVARQINASQAALAPQMKASKSIRTRKPAGRPQPAMIAGKRKH